MQVHNTYILSSPIIRVYCLPVYLIHSRHLKSPPKTAAIRSYKYISDWVENKDLRRYFSQRVDDPSHRMHGEQRECMTIYIYKYIYYNLKL